MMTVHKSELELEADRLLEKQLKDKRRNKTRLEEYPILSDSQLQRRWSREIPYSNLSLRQRMQADFPTDMDD